MVTEKQLIANRENGKLGGVKTEAGKQVTRLNAITHGLLTKAVLKPGEKTTLLNHLRDNLVVEKEPEGELETIMVVRIVSCLWWLKRALNVESNMISDDNANLAYSTFTLSWQTLGRYETMIERQMYKAIHELERMQRARLGENIPAPLAIDVDLSQHN